MSVAVTPLEIFRAKGIPHRRMEDWKYSDLRSVLDADAFSHPHGVTIALRTPDEIETVPIAMNETPDWVANRLERFQKVGAMAAAAQGLAAGGTAVRVPGNSHVESPIDLAFHGAGHGQIVLIVEAGASAVLVETQHPSEDGLRNVSLLIALEDGARLTHIRQSGFAGAHVNVETMAVHIGKNAAYRAHFASAGAKLSRTELEVALAGEGAEAELSGLSVLADGAHADLTTHMDHKAGKTKSTQLFKVVAGGKSRGVYQGKITVREGADGSDSRQTAKGLLLGARAEIDLKPELEIFADDVKCAHGAAVGDLDADSLFYLRSRGIPEAEARALLIRAFLEEAVDGIERDDIRADVWQFVEAGLARSMEAQP